MAEKNAELDPEVIEDEELEINDAINGVEAVDPETGEPVPESPEEK